MDNNDIAEKLNGLLGDPQAMAQIMSIAGSLMGSAGESSEAPMIEPSFDQSDSKQALSGIESALPALMSIVGDSKKNDPRASLLYALKPYMNAGRAEKIDMFVKLLKLMDIAGGFLGSGGIL